MRIMKKMIYLSLLFFAGCWTQAWQLDYGSSIAQFTEEDLASLSSGYAGQLITVKGILREVNHDDPDNIWVYLKNGTRCNVGNFTTIDHYQAGDTVFLKGFVDSQDTEGIVLQPAIVTSPIDSFPSQSPAKKK